MRGRRFPFLVPALVVCLLLVPASGLAGPAGPVSGGVQVAAAEAAGSIPDLLGDLNDALRSANESLESLNAVLKAENEALKQENALLRSQIEAAQGRLQELEAQRGPAAPTVEGLAAQLRSRVFRVDVYDYGGRLVGTGSAVAVSASDVITNYHVVEGAWSAELVTEAGARHPVLGMTAFDQARDLAVLRVTGPLEPVSLRTAPARTGEEVVAIGSPVGLTNSVSTGIVSAVRNLDGREVIQVTAPISHGSSGGGLFDRQGDLIGITFGGMEDGQNLNFAIPVGDVQQLLSAVGPLQELPGVNQVTRENLVAVLQQSHPVLELPGHRVAFQYVLLPDPEAGPGQSPDILLMVMDNEQYDHFASGMLTGSIEGNLAAVESFLLEVGKVADQAYPGLDVAVLLLHAGEYAEAPPQFDYEEIEYDPDSGMWQVFHAELLVSEWNGEWYSEWSE